MNSDITGLWELRQISDRYSVAVCSLHTRLQNYLKKTAVIQAVWNDINLVGDGNYKLAEVCNDVSLAVNYNITRLLETKTLMNHSNWASFTSWTRPSNSKIIANPRLVINHFRAYSVTGYVQSGRRNLIVWIRINSVWLYRCWTKFVGGTNHNITLAGLRIWE